MLNHVYKTIAANKKTGNHKGGTAREIGTSISNANAIKNAKKLMMKLKILYNMVIYFLSILKLKQK